MRIVHLNAFACIAWETTSA